MAWGEEHELVARVVSSQDTRAFGELIRRHQSHVRNFLRKLSGDMSAADDLAQDCFMRAWDKLHTYSGSGSFIGWLLKIAYTTFLQSRRKSKRYAEILEQVGHVSEAEARTHTVQSDEPMFGFAVTGIVDKDAECSPLPWHPPPSRGLRCARRPR